MEPLSGNMEEMASKILSEGNFLVLSLLVRPGDDTSVFCQGTKLTFLKPPAAVSSHRSQCYLPFFKEEFKA